MYYTAKVMGVIFSNPPFHIVKCVVADHSNLMPSMVVKGKFVGSAERGSVFSFKGRPVTDKKGRSSIEIKRMPVRYDLLSGEAKAWFDEWNGSDAESVGRLNLLATIAESGANVSVLNSLWGLVRSNADVIRDNPWMLVDKGLSFNSADMVARALHGSKFDPHNPHRVASATFWSVYQGVKQGNVYLDANTVFSDARRLTGVEDVKVLAQAVKGMRDNNRLIVEKTENGNAIYHPSYHRMECEVAEHLISRSQRDASVETYSSDYIRGFSRYGLTEDQVEAVRKGLTLPVSITTGLPGTGKTTILRTLCKILTQEKQSILLVAPTGIAAKRASDITGLEAQTIHRAFGAGAPDESKEASSEYAGVIKDESDYVELAPNDPTKEFWKANPHTPLSPSVVIVDEASMVDLHLLWRMLEGVSYSTRIIFVGDVEQLPPVGVGFTLKDMIASQTLPRTHLTKVFRQGEGSAVVEGAHAIHRGESPKYQGDFELIRVRSPKLIGQKIVDICKSLHAEGVDYHVVSPTHHGEAGVTELNKTLRSALNPNRANLRTVRVGSDEIRVGDKILITKNDYDLEVYNGDVGRIEQINSVSVLVTIKGAKMSVIEVPIERVGSLIRLSYATTVHKAQGQEYHTVIVPLTTTHSRLLLKRSLIYTAVTRAKVKVILVGDKAAMDVAVSNNEDHAKYSRLSPRMAALLP